jgi:SsrA-binding protein
MAPKKKPAGIKIAAENRKARHSYLITQTFEAGIELKGTEVKSLRSGKANLADAYAIPLGGDILLRNAHIPEYSHAGEFYQHEPRRPRRLLMHRREIHKLSIAVEREGMTLVPLKIYFNEKGRAKIEIALAKGKKLHDKRAADRDRTWQRDKARLMRQKQQG